MYFVTLYMKEKNNINNVVVTLYLLENWKLIVSFEISPETYISKQEWLII